MEIKTFFFHMTIFGNVRILTVISPKPSELFCSNFQDFSYLLLSSNDTRINIEIIHVSKIALSR